MKKDFYIFRHGQSTYNLAGRTQGRTNDSVLTDLGKSQALEVGKKLKGKNIQAIICSPLNRAKQTAELANQSLNVPVVYDDHFIEVNVGEIEGMHYEDIQAKFGEKYQQWRSLDRKYENLCFKGGETKKQVRERVFEGLNSYANDNKYSALAISSHGIMLDQILLTLGVENEKVANGSILHLEFDNGNWTVKGFVS